MYATVSSSSTRHPDEAWHGSVKKALARGGGLEGISRHLPSCKILTTPPERQLILEEHSPSCLDAYVRLPCGSDPRMLTCFGSSRVMKLIVINSSGEVYRYLLSVRVKNPDSLHGGSGYRCPMTMHMPSSRVLYSRALGTLKYLSQMPGHILDLPTYCPGTTLGEQYSDTELENPKPPHTYLCILTQPTSLLLIIITSLQSCQSNIYALVDVWHLRNPSLIVSCQADLIIMLGVCM
ncbi:hypothetical protein DFH27DRAFT_522774 [Peziza echinospora]|nr:hypothetical protein DFH27DRAFT_522774 [Peziza echinospora]